MLIPDGDLRNHIELGSSTMEIRKASLNAGMKTLRTEGVYKILSGHTSIEEVVRVTTEDVFADNPTSADTIAVD